MSKFLAISGWVLGAAALAVFLWYVAKPWVSPLYQRYLAYVLRKALGE